MKLAKIFMWYLVCSLPISSVMDSLDKHLLILSAEIKWSHAGVLVCIFSLLPQWKDTLKSQQIYIVFFSYFIVKGAFLGLYKHTHTHRCLGTVTYKKS